MKYLLTLIGLIGLVLFALFVWPTKYRYDQIHRGSGISNPVRINRFTGQAEILYPNGWKSAEAETPGPATINPYTVPASAPSSAQEKPGAEPSRRPVKHVDVSFGKAVGFSDDGTLTLGTLNGVEARFGTTCDKAHEPCEFIGANIVNHSQVPLSRIQVKVTAPAHNVVDKLYWLTCEDDGRPIPPDHDGSCSGPPWKGLEFHLSLGETWSVQLVNTE